MKIQFIERHTKRSFKKGQFDINEIIKEELREEEVGDINPKYISYVRKGLEDESAVHVEKTIDEDGHETFEISGDPSKVENLTGRYA
jgi:hypothetical protein